MKHSTIYFLAALICFEAGVTAQLSKIWVLAIMMYLATVIFAVKLMFENNTREDKIIRNQDKIQRDLSALYDYLEHNHIMTADEIKAVTEQEDKPRGNIRPGSRPSIEYMNLRVEKEAGHDTGRTITSITSKAENETKGPCQKSRINRSDNIDHRE